MKMKLAFIFMFSMVLVSTVYGQDCKILSKANNILPDKLCSPVSATWQVSYTGVNDAGTTVEIQYDWDDGSVQNVIAVNSGPCNFFASSRHTYLSNGNKCNYHPKATLVVNGVLCTSSTQQQIVTVWDDDNHNGGHMHIHPDVYPVCLGNGADVRFRDLTQFNCVPPQEKDVPNQNTRWIQWIYGTASSMTGKPVTINGAITAYPDTGTVITLTGPVNGSGVYSDIINVANDKQVGQFFQVTLRNWNYCNPYDDPNIPGPPADPVNGDHPPVVTTAIILIVPLPDATITPVDTLCLNGDPVTLNAHDRGGTWSGAGVTGNRFNPGLAGAGNHKIRYAIMDGNGCSDVDSITITVVPAPAAVIQPVGTMIITDPPVLMSAAPAGGKWSGDGVAGNYFDPKTAGLGEHIVKYLTPPDRYGCSGSDTIHIKVIMPEMPVAGFDSVPSGCSPLQVSFKNSSTSADSYLWDFGDKTYSDIRNPYHVYYIPGTYLVGLTVTNLAGQSYHKQVINVYQNPTASFTVYPTDVFNNTQIVVFTDHSFYADTYLWKFGDGLTSTNISPWHKYESQGTYNVTLTVSTKDGCIDSSAYFSPILVEFREGEIKFPNAFRWNQSGPTGGYWEENGIDDTTFRPFFNNVISYNLQIFNRWGELVYESHDLMKGWDGYFATGELAVQGVYVWIVKGQYADGTYFSKVGDVTFLH